MLDRMARPAVPEGTAPSAVSPSPAKAQSPPAAARAAPERRAGIGSRIGSVLYYLFLAALLIGVLLYSRSGSNSSFFGYRYYNVLTTSMQSVYPRGSMVFVRMTDPKNIRVGDDITFYRDPKTIITHRVIEVIPDLDGEGTPGFRTKGVDNVLPDQDPVLGANVVGTVSLSCPLLGDLFSYIRERFWLVALMMILLTATIGALRRLFRRECKHLKTRRSSRSHNQVSWNRKDVTQLWQK